MNIYVIGAQIKDVSHFLSDCKTPTLLFYFEMMGKVL